MTQWGWVLAAVGVVAVVVVVWTWPWRGSGSAGSAAGTTAQGAAMQFGVLGSTCDAGRARALHTVGVRYAEMGVDWSAFEPRQGAFDRAYQAKMQRAVRTCHAAGIQVVLALGLNSAPGWVADLPAGAYVDQGGRPGRRAVPNVVFSAAVRTAVGGYLTELQRVLNLNSVAAVRVGTGENGELGYPSSDTTTANPYWAFDPAAQRGIGLAAGMAVSPMAGWTPGAATWRGAQVSTGDVDTWFRWYSDSVADAAVWVVQQLRAVGYTGQVHLPLAGRGVLPADLQHALAARLDGAAQPDGSLQAGLYYPEQLQRIAQALKGTEKPGWGPVVVDSTSLDDSSATAARQLHPPQDGCRADDATHLSDPDVGNWPSSRWTVANARAAGFGVVGENPGPPDAAGTGSDAQTDSSAQQMVHAPAYAQQCGMTLFQWAFEDGLFSDGQGALRAYGQRQKALAGGGSK